MKNLVLIALFAIGLMSVTTTQAQSIDAEKTYQITGKAKRGKLANAQQLPDGNYQLVYLTKAKSKKILFQEYLFDSDFNFISMEDGEIPLEKVKTKYTWFNFKGEEYYVDGITLNWNPAMPLKLKKKRTTYKYDWLFLGYYKKVEVLDKVKPRTDDGKKYFAKAYFEDEVNGDLYIIVGVASGLASKDALDQFTDIRIIKFDWDLNKVGELEIPFDYCQEVAFAQGFSAPDPENPQAVGFDGGMVVFAPLKMKGGETDPDKSNFTFVEFDKDLNLITRESFNSPSPGWAIEGAQWIDYGAGNPKDIYVYGPAAFGKDKYHQLAIQSGKKKSIQVMKVGQGKVEFVTESDIEKFAELKIIPPSAKKTRDFDGKANPALNFLPMSGSEFMLYGQYYKDGKPGDYIAMHFDSNGNLVKNYMKNMAVAAKFPYPVPHFMVEGKNGVYWESYEVTGSPELPYLFPTLTKIDPNKKVINDPLVLGKEGKKHIYFIDKSYPKLGLSADQVVYFGSDKKGKNIWFCRVNFD